MLYVDSVDLDGNASRRVFSGVREADNYAQSLRDDPWFATVSRTWKSL